MSFILAWARSAFGRGCGHFGEQIIREPLGRVVRDAAAVEPAHVAGRTGGNEHVFGGQAVGGRFQVQQILLRGEHDAVLGLRINFDLRMIGAEMALAAGAGQPGDFHGGRVPGMAERAVADAAVGVGFANRVTGDAAALRRRIALQFRQRMRRTFHRAGMQFFHLVNHLRRKILVAHDRHPRRRGVAAPHKLVIDRQHDKPGSWLA